MKRLYVPWRGSYTKSVGEYNKNSKETDCTFCQQFNENNDEKYLILRRFKHIVARINLYPYNPGHLLLLSQDHTAHLEDLSEEARIELITLTTHATTMLKNTLKCQGINIGMNLGKAAGAGIPHHLHLHIVPRWDGDTNFLPVIGETKTISEDLLKIYTALKPAFDQLTL
jgi:ATP adenylyltransferase